MKKVKIVKYVNNNRKMTSFGKTYGRIKHEGVLTVHDVAKHIQKHGSIFTPDIVKGVVQRFSECIEELLQDGYKVKLDGLGTFYLSISTKGENNEEDFTLSNIKKVCIRFMADKSKEFDWNSKTQTTRSNFIFVKDDEDTDNPNSGSGSDSGNSGSGNTPSQEDAGEDRP